MRALPCALLVALLPACGGSPQHETAPLHVHGSLQKGPFILGTPALISAVNPDGSIGELLRVATVEDNRGGFDFELIAPGPVQLLGTGYFFNEVTGDVSAGVLTLESLVDVTADGQRANVNVLTHLTARRARELMAVQQLDVASASAIAEAELVSALHEVLPVDDPGAFAELDLYDGGMGSAYLLALSAALYEYAALQAADGDTSSDARLSLALNLISTDLADDGQLEMPELLHDLLVALRHLAPERIAENLKDRAALDGSELPVVPDISPFFGLCAGAATCAWRAAAPMPEPSRSHAAVEWSGKLLVFGGETGDDYKRARQYDAETNSWTPLADMPRGLYVLTGHRIDDVVYLFGGYGLGGFDHSVLRYDAVNDAWSEGTPMPTYRYQFMSAVVGGKVYVIGGVGMPDDGPWAPGSDSWPNKDYVAIYDPALDAWSSGAPIPTPTAGGVACAVGETIFVFAVNWELPDGYVKPVSSPIGYAYDTASDSWSPVTPPEPARAAPACIVRDGTVWLFGGNAVLEPDPDAPIYPDPEDPVVPLLLDLVDIYDPASDTWTPAERLPAGRMEFSATEVGEDLYLAGGSLGGPPLDTVDVLDWSLLPQ